MVHSFESTLALTIGRSVFNLNFNLNLSFNFVEGNWRLTD